MEYRDYYQALGVERSATAEDVKKAYRRLARKYHPDVSREPNAEEKFKDVQEAYEVLKDPEKRAAYDQLGSQWKQGQSFRPPPDWTSGFEFSGPGAEDAASPRGGSYRFEFGDGGEGQGFAGGHDFGEGRGFSEFFASLFGGGAGSPFAGGGHARRGRDHHARLDIDLEEAYRGATRTLELKRPEMGSDGRVELATHTVRVSIPAGVADGQLIRLAGQGEPGVDGGKPAGRGAAAGAGRGAGSAGGRGEGSAAGAAPPGDLYLEVHVRPHRLYALTGRDVTLTLPIAPWEAALGATVTAPTLGGPVELRIPAGSQSGRKLRLRGRGLPGQPAGDQYVLLDVVVPPADSPAARALYEQMQRELAFDPRAGLPH
jgi:curved DNA-binding protein